jgi:hypothetical protein
MRTESGLDEVERPVQEVTVYRACDRPPVGGHRGHDQQPHAEQLLA